MLKADDHRGHAALLEFSLGMKGGDYKFSMLEDAIKEAFERGRAYEYSKRTGMSLEDAVDYDDFGKGSLG